MPAADYSRQARYRKRNWDAYLARQRDYLRQRRLKAKKAAKSTSRRRVIHKKAAV